MIKNVQVVSTDVDGTILNESGELPSKNIDAIKKIHESGKYVLINTGRGQAEVAEIFAEQGLKCAKSCLNGSIVLDENNNVIAKEIIERNDAIKIIGILGSAESFFVVFTSGGNFLLPYFSQKDNYKKIKEELSSFDQGFIDYFKKGLEEGRVEEIESFEKLLIDESIEYYKFIVISRSPDVLEATKQELLKNADLLITSSWIDNIEINAKSASKGNGLKKYIEKLGLKPENAMAIGDNYNDVSMFEVAGTAVAMGNASDDIKEMCDYVTESNGENGWANAVTKFVL